MSIGHPKADTNPYDFSPSNQRPWSTVKSWVNVGSRPLGQPQYVICSLERGKNPWTFPPL